MTGPFQIGDEGREVGPDQSSFLDDQRHGSLEGTLTTTAPVLGTGMLLNGQRRPRAVNLLHDAGKVTIAAQAAATVGAGVEHMFLETSHLLGWKRLAFVFGMAGLATDRPALPALRAGTRRFDNIRGRWFGRGRGILLSRSQLFLEAQDFCLQSLELNSLSIKLPLQPAALWT